MTTATELNLAVNWIFVAVAGAVIVGAVILASIWKAATR